MTDLTPHQAPPRSGLEGFEALMPYRIREILLVSSLYDSFILQEDGQMLEPLLADYSDLNLRHAPRVRRASTTAEATELLESGQFDLVLITPQLGGLDPVSFAEELREEHGALPIVMLGYDALQVQALLADREHPFDAVLLYTGDSRILVAIIKLIEDRVNVLHDSKQVGVQAVLLVEDNVNFLSTYLPLLYSEILEQQQRVLSEGLNQSQRLLRMRARPKVILAQDYESAVRLYLAHREHLMGIICDAGFPRRRGESIDMLAGFDFVRALREQSPFAPVLVQSSNPENAKRAAELRAAFLDKNSPRLLQGVREFMLDNFGFGPFRFRGPHHELEGEAATVRELEEMLPTVSKDSVLNHAVQNHFSTWLRARTEFDLADRLAETKVEDFRNVDAIKHFLTSMLHEARTRAQRGVIAEFDRRHFDSTVSFARIGRGSLGGKARGLAFVNFLIRYYRPGEALTDATVIVPTSVVLTTEVFDRFMAENDLYGVALGDLPDHALRRQFLAAALPQDVVEDLRRVCSEFQAPLAVRSSSLLEDSHLQPFAGVYETYMLPNTESSIDDRLRALCRAVKMVYASTYSARAKAFMRATPYHHEEEKMAVVIQELFGRTRGDHFYPTFAGVARSHNYYPHGPARPEDGVASVALGLGKLVVDGLGGLRFCPRHPRSIPHFSAVSDILENAQRQFFALSLEPTPPDAEGAEDFQPDLLPIEKADEDGTLSLLGSVYSPENETITDGTSRPGYRLVTFASVLKHDVYPLAPLVDELLQLASWGMGCPIEIEFAVDMEAPTREPRQLAVLQLRPLVLPREQDQIELGDFDGGKFVCASERALGNGRIQGLEDVLFVDPEEFDRAQSQSTSLDIQELNARLQQEGRPYVLIGPGRWGSSDPWLGVPVAWSDIAGARVVVETGFADMAVKPSEGSHFFNNMTSFHVGYLTVNPQKGEGVLDLEWLRAQPTLEARDNGVRLVRLSDPLTVLLDGRTARGAILKPNGMPNGERS